MSYKSWHKQHYLKHKEIVDRLFNLTDDEIIEYFDYENMKRKEEDFCILYKKNKKCHEIESLNCYLCACPNFRIDIKKSFCNIDSKDGGVIEIANFIHQNCSNCIVPHNKEYIKTIFNRDWNKIMKNTFLNKN
jgi:Zn-finger protein